MSGKPHDDGNLATNLLTILLAECCQLCQMTVTHTEIGEYMVIEMNIYEEYSIKMQ